ncbi:MAG TPA: DNA polymerase IV [Candidatus Binatia bacterium]|nr:DNA polymerase IV [Candidatus Binatia bacterium]
MRLFHSLASVLTPGGMLAYSPNAFPRAMGWYLHIDMDAFYASVEQVLDPSLGGKPVIVGGRNGRGVVTSASYEARKFGVYSAMPGFRAKQLCPQGIFLPNRRRVYSEFSDKVFAILDQYSPEVHAISIDEGIVDLTGTENLFGPPLRTADRIIKRLKTELGLPASGGLSTSRVIAKIAATLAKPNGLIFVPAGGEAPFLSPLDVKIIPGVGPKTHKALLQRGIKTVGDMLAHQQLASRYLDLRESAERGRHHDHSVGNETTLAEPLKDKQAMREVLWKLIEEVGGRLRREKLYARCLTLKIRYTNFATITRSRTLAVPTCFDREIFEVVSALLAENVSRARAVRLLGVSASALQTSGWQEPLFGSQKRKSLEKLYRGIDQLRQKYGEATIGSATPKNRSG